MTEPTINEKIQRLFQDSRLTDRPIEYLDDDLLNRKAFAISLAKIIQGWTRQEDSLILSLYGEWGSGKSSIKNMLIDHLKKLPSSKTTIIEFNPWEWAGQGELMREFFAEVGADLGKEKGDKSKRLAELWNTVGSYFTAGSSFVSGIERLSISLLALSAVAGIGGWFGKASWVGATLAIIGAIAAIFAVILTWGGTFAQSVAKAVESRLSLGKKSLREVKTEFGHILSDDMETNVLVVIDDIDRLAKEDVKLLFQMLKANANLPNMVYLLLFQHDIIEDALHQYFPGGAEKFLEKIIQCPFHVPVAERDKVEEILVQGLNHLESKHRLETLIDNKRFAEFWIHGLHLYFRTLREVKRYLATLDTYFGMFSQHGQRYEVNPVDLMILEVIRQFEPDVYSAIPQAKFALTGEWSGPVVFQFSEEERTAMVQNLYKIAHNEQLLREILPILFPRIPAILKGEETSGGRDEMARRQLRVSHHDIFDRYFTLNIPEGQVSESALQNVIDVAKDRNALVTSFEELQSKGLLAKTITQLRYYVNEIAPNNPTAFIAALFDIGDKYLTEPQGPLSVSADAWATTLIEELLKREYSPLQRTGFLLDAIQVSAGIYLPSLVTIRQDRDYFRTEKVEHFYITDEEFSKLREACLGKITQYAESNYLSHLSSVKLVTVLRAWCQWDRPTECGDWIEKNIMSSRELFLPFLVSFLNTSAHPLHSIDLSRIDKLISVGKIEEYLEHTDLSSVTDIEQKAIDEFRREMENQNENKSATLSDY